jgi:hypothetical protein
MASTVSLLLALFLTCSAPELQPHKLDLGRIALKVKMKR